MKIKIHFLEKTFDYIFKAMFRIRKVWGKENKKEKWEENKK